MATLYDSERTAAYHDALSNWNYEGYVCFELTETAYKWLRTEFDNITFRELARLMHEFVESGCEVDEVRETRERWSGEYEFHHDLRFSIQGKPSYVETRLHFRQPFEPDTSTITVVNTHAP